MRTTLDPRSHSPSILSRLSRSLMTIAFDDRFSSLLIPFLGDWFDYLKRLGWFSTMSGLHLVLLHSVEDQTKRVMIERFPSDDDWLTNLTSVESTEKPVASLIRGVRVPKIRGSRRVCGLSRCSCFGGYGGTEAPPPPPPLPPPSRFGHHHHQQQQQRPHEQRGTERWWTPGATRTVHEGKLDVRRGKSIGPGEWWEESRGESETGEGASGDEGRRRKNRDVDGRRRTENACQLDNSTSTSRP
ncbi:hypothetical protein K0M31_007637 [Melipona bicolor]|uniref:Uncharacterized protein n=1 Tax=Melipona bicolor TaxID=60889 RepID=A0AA40GBW3_9HYME|nr:hypothetical protein K0M31_007637 [Melipona bicolor]